MNKVMSFRSRRPSPLSLDEISNVEGNGLVGFCWKVHGEICNSKSKGLHALLHSRAGVHVDMGLVTEHDMTALHVVSSLPKQSRQKLPLLRWLLDNGAKVDSRDTFDRSPLDIVWKMMDESAKQLLCEYGAAHTSTQNWSE